MKHPQNGFLSKNSISSEKNFFHQPTKLINGITVVWFTCIIVTIILIHHKEGIKMSEFTDDTHEVLPTNVRNCDDACSDSSACSLNEVMKGKLKDLDAPLWPQLDLRTVKAIASGTIIGPQPCSGTHMSTLGV